MSTPSRRTFLQIAATAATIPARPPRRALAIGMHSTQSPSAFSSVKALVFDVFGTVVDWRSSVAREVEVGLVGVVCADAGTTRGAPCSPRADGLDTVVGGAGRASWTGSTGTVLQPVREKMTVPQMMRRRISFSTIDRATDGGPEICCSAFIGPGNCGD